MTDIELRKLKDGDIIRNHSGNAYTVLRNTGHCVIATRTLEVSDADKWELVYTSSPVPAAPVSLVEKISELEKLGWIYEDTNDRWYSPDGKTWTNSLQSAWTSRNAHVRAALPVRSFTSFAEARLALRDAGWKNPYGKTWCSPGGNYFEGAREAYAALIQGDGTCNAS